MRQKFCSFEKLVWVDVDGLLVRSWSKDAFRKIIAKWGRIVHLEDDQGENV